MVNKNAQEWLDEKYPLNGTCQRDSDSVNKSKSRSGITHLDIRKSKVGNFFNGHKTLVDSLKLEGFTNLRTLIVSSHQLISLDVSDCPNLEELDCHGNELISLKVGNCPNLKKIDCSNNNLSELDLNNCPKLEIANINNNPNLTEDKIESSLAYNPEKGKLVKDDAKVKSGPQIIKAKENDVRNILIVGITGNGKSTLANVLTGTNQFTEKASSTSVTKNFQKSDVFEWKGKKYQVIDNIGFSDSSRLSKKDLLFKVGEGIHSTKEGINQVLFVFKGRFSEDQLIAFNLFKDFIAETDITRVTTIIKTGFKDFKKKEVCEKDKQELITQTKELGEIIKSCNNVLYVDNPPIPKIESEDDEEEKEDKEKRIGIYEKKREESRKIVLDYLTENCQNVYKLKSWDDISSMVEDYIKKREEIEKDSSNNKKEKIERIENKVAEEVNVRLGAEISAFPKLTAQVEMRNPSFWPFNKK